MENILITGGAGFIGSHLVERYLETGHRVVCIDNFLTGSRENIGAHENNPALEVIEHDVTVPFDSPEAVSVVIHLASPASPIDYLRFPVETLGAGSLGTLNALNLAMSMNARFVLASTSEVYGDPAVHPQPESYWGNVNPIGPRSVYDEAKRFGEALTMAFRRHRDTNAGIVRIFNCFGPRMRLFDGRAVPTFIRQALGKEPLTVAGDGSQTRSLCYVDDIVEGIFQFAKSDGSGPLNLGNPEEVSMLDLAKEVIHLTGSPSHVEFIGRPQDDPERRLPDITAAKGALAWEPRVTRADGLARTIDWFEGRL
ncbi:UDP-glucuronic acid decarboxylase family protein [Streptomyces acidiscabies]|uniref:SDR family oxidoreductase n=1 Tax=Streptomyces acidiscabies TaxID=42234 RepID=A0AAP6BL98_9ACTN|nr:UDP-glucuronic acid decarboxylase family protein [Streptomyces acidiscabies]MBP5935519.1 SDR family oxidoreductase [Streptomyces sp. LBUM 1476]MBZ3916609.1 SDR family oxidoreductase [Streptomyces acidiscabies]MDX2966884.1 SDR family oxidoreductase [Streptomyces acidiscabies]MDX3020287.1 SDR family oxidoreductase [Streptomyces acidiscabies]MDX3791723.1 SDR family oxidoreductase [Streptomyces acidiscabies]